jgi:hypothetical protein
VTVRFTTAEKSGGGGGVGDARHRRHHHSHHSQRRFKGGTGPAPGPCVRVRVGIMGPGKYANVGKCQSVLIMTNPIIFTRTRRATLCSCLHNLLLLLLLLLLLGGLLGPWDTEAHLGIRIRGPVVFAMFPVPRFGLAWLVWRLVGEHPFAVLAAAPVVAPVTAPIGPAELAVAVLGVREVVALVAPPVGEDGDPVPVPVPGDEVALVTDDPVRQWPGQRPVAREPPVPARPFPPSIS